MSFLSIAFLTALPLAAAPILLHLFDRRRNVVIEWGAMQFLQEAATRKTSPRRFQHWLLLLLRVGAIAALVLALARPLLPGNWLARQDRQEVILVLDNSMSTLRDPESDGESVRPGKKLFDELLVRAGEVLDELPTGNTVRVLAASPYPVWVTPTGVRINLNSRMELRNRLQELHPTQGMSDLLGALLKAVQLDLEDKSIPLRRIVLLTDGQRADWKTNYVNGWTRFRDVLAGAPVPTSVEVVEISPQKTPGGNIAVQELRANHTVVGVNQPFTVRAVVRNHSVTPSTACPTIWSVGDATLQESQLPALVSGETHEIEWKHSFSRPGVFKVSCRADARDDLPTDNTSTVVIEAVDRIPVLLVEGSESLAEMQQDAYLIQAALGRVQGDQAQDWRAVFDPKAIAPPQLETIDLAEYRAVVIPNLTDLSRKAIQRLTAFVSAGGGLWVALGPRADIREFNRLFFQDGEGLAPVAIDRVVEESRDDSKYASINPFPKNHPATADLAGEEQLDLGDVKITGRVRFRLPAAANEVPVLLDLTNGDPLVVENHVGRGRVIVQAIPLRWQWSDLAASQAFVVMVHEWLSYLTEPGATQHNLKPGEPISIRVASSKQADATLTTPAGEDITVTGEPADDGMTFRTSRTILPGNYSLDVGLSGDGIPFSVARDSAESDLSNLNADNREFLAETAGLRGGRMADRIAGTNKRDPVWPALLVLLVAVIASELVLSGAIARQRFGTDPIPETVQPGEAINHGLRGIREQEQHVPSPLPADGMDEMHLGKSEKNRNSFSNTT